MFWLPFLTSVSPKGVKSERILDFLRGPCGRSMPTAHSPALSSSPTSSSSRSQRSCEYVSVMVLQTAQQSPLRGPLLPQQSFHLVSLTPRKKMDMGRRFVCAFEAGSGHFAGTSRGLVTQSMIQEKGTWVSHSADTWLPHERGGWKRPGAGPCKVHASCPGLRVVGQHE